MNIGFDLPILDVNYDVVQILFGHAFGQLNQSLVKVCEVLVRRFHNGNSAVGKQLLHFRFDRIEIARQQVRLYPNLSMQSKGENFTESLLYLLRRIGFDGKTAFYVDYVLLLSINDF